MGGNMVKPQKGVATVLTVIWIVLSAVFIIVLGALFTGFVMMYQCVSSNVDKVPKDVSVASFFAIFISLSVICTLPIIAVALFGVRKSVKDIAALFTVPVAFWCNLAAYSHYVSLQLAGCTPPMDVNTLNIQRMLIIMIPVALATVALIEKMLREFSKL